VSNKFLILLGVGVAALMVGCILFTFLLVFPNYIEPTSIPTPTSMPTPTQSNNTEANGSHASNPIIVADSSVFEGEKWMKIFDNGTVKGYSYHLYPWYKDIEIKEGNVSREEIDVLLELFSNLADYNKYEVNLSNELIGDDHIFEPLGSMKISCLPLNKTIELSFRPPSFPEPETITPEAEEILAKIDKIYRETEVVERINEANPP